MKVKGLPEAVAATSSSEYVTPIKLSYPEGLEADLAAVELSVDLEGSLIVRSSSDIVVIIPREHWSTLEKLINFARKRS